MSVERRPLVPDGWNRPGFAAAMAHIVQHQAKYPTYPRADERLVYRRADLPYDDRGRLNVPYLPHEPWALTNVPQRSRMDPRRLMRRNGYQDAGQTLSHRQSSRIMWPETPKPHQLDARGFPLHPNTYHMLLNRDIGALTGSGAYPKLGPNNMAHVVMLAPNYERNVAKLMGLLVVRRDSLTFGVPEYPMDVSTNAIEVATEGLRVDTGLNFPRGQFEELDVGPLADPRTTIHAGTRSHLLVATLPEIPDDKLELSGGASVEWAAWMAITASTLDNRMFGALGGLVRQAVQDYEYTYEETYERPIRVLDNATIVQP